jgi:limonene-1,2-epoxide hydrolase
VTEPADKPSWHKLLEAIDAESDPVRRANLEIVARHVVAEVAEDFDGVLDTLTPDPHYEFWGVTQMKNADGRAAVAAHYDQLATVGMARLEFHISRVIADASNVVTEGEFRFTYSGTACRSTGVVGASEFEDDVWYLVALHSLVVWPIDDSGRITGEIVYGGEKLRLIRALAPGEMPHLGPASRAVPA